MPVSLGAKPEHDFNDPLGLLSDCHRRIERFLGILLRVAEQRDESGGSPALDREHREALEAALQYFRVALPRHTLDEEESLFPRLRASSNTEAQSALQTLSELEADHAAADARHLRVDELGKHWLAHGRLEPDQLAEMRTLLTELRDVYTRHIRVEDTSLFPAARHVLDRAQVEQIGKEMADRRGLGRQATSAMSGSAGL